MCGIFAYAGNMDCRDILLSGLKKLEYRGYDSAGIVALQKSGEKYIGKAVGKVSRLASKVDSEKDSSLYTLGIAHTRWATHGKVTLENTHPHSSSQERFYVVHNGIIENYKELKKDLEKKYDFYSDTDTEVIAKLIEKYFENNLKTTIEKISTKLVGAYSLAVVDTKNPTQIIGVKLGSPMIVAKSEEAIYLSSDIQALPEDINSYTILDDNEMVVLSKDDFSIYAAGKEIQKDSEAFSSSEAVSDLGTFSSYTEKEIYDIPDVLKNVFRGRIDFESKDIVNETLEQISSLDISRVEVISSGSSYFAGEIGCYFLRSFAGVHASGTISSEFLSDSFIPDNKTLYVFLSQSGETADVRESMKIVKAKGCTTFSIVNVVGSTIARMSDYGLYSHAGVETGVASTKNVIAQIATLLMLALSFGKKRDMQISDIRNIISELERLPDMITHSLMQAPYIKDIAKKYAKYEDMFVLGRNYFYPVASEIALKCKELSYIHAESYSAGELKHGPLALVSPDFPTLVCNPVGKFYSKTISNIQEVVARGGPVIGIVSKNDSHSELYNDSIILPESSELISVFTSLTLSYIFALYLAEELGRDVDKPRNLAKSVTVE